VNGGALALYCASMLLTDVVRTLLLLYVAPMWGRSWAASCSANA